MEVTLKILDLPVELIEQIVSILDQNSPPPSIRLLHEPPSEKLFESLNVCTLKNLAVTCKPIRNLVVPRLFAHLKVQANDPRNLMDFRKSINLHKRPKSMLLYSRLDDYPSSCLPDANTDYMRSIRTRVTWMVDLVDPQTLTIVAPPSCLGWFVDHVPNIADSWVFQTTYQMMKLEQGTFAPKQWFPRGTVHDNSTLSTVRPWNYCSYNEGSFIPAYSTYEYHLYEPPSLHQPQLISELKCHALQLACLRTFELVAVFPFNHMRHTCWFLVHLPELQELTVQLAPSPKSQKQNATASSASSPSDFWLELETNYDLLRDCVGHTLLSLSTYRILDYASLGYRGTIDAAMTEIPADWKPNGNGVWTRQLVPRPLGTPPMLNTRPICPKMELAH